MFNIFVLNIRSIRSNFNELCLYLDNVRNKEYDIIVLTESWVYNNEIRYYSLGGYTTYLSKRENKRSGGVVLYVKSIYDIVSVNVINKFTLMQLPAN